MTGAVLSIVKLTVTWAVFPARSVAATSKRFVPTAKEIRREKCVLTAPLSAPLQLDGDVIEIDAPVEIRLAQERVVLLAAPADAS